MRIALIFALVLAAGCAKKQKPAATPAATENKAVDAPGGGATGAEPDAETKDGTEATGDPCDGGETKSK